MPSPKKLVLLALFILVSAFALAAQTPSQSEDNSRPTFVVPDVGNRFSLIAYGDMRITNPEDHEHTNPEVRRALVQKIAEEKPSALLISGDVPYRGGKNEDWEVADAELKPLWDAKIRIYPALGNHEIAGGEAAGLANWWKRFPQLDQKRWYSVQFGNCYIIALDSDSKLTADSPQWKWITSQLAHLPAETDFVFLTMHHPSYTDSHDHMIPGGGHSARSQEQHLAEYLEALQPKIRARLIAVAGHVHNYERFEKNGVTYLVSGGGGATPYLFDRSPADKYQGGKTVNYHYLQFEIDGTKLKAKMIKLGMDGQKPLKFEERDSFQLEAAKEKAAPKDGFR